MSYVVGSGSYRNSYGSANAMDIWNQNNGYTPEQVAGYGGLRGLGALEDVGTFITGLGSGTVLVVAGLLAFAYLSTRSEKKEKLKKARDEYNKKVAEIRGEYGTLGLGKYGRRSN